MYNFATEVLFPPLIKLGVSDYWLVTLDLYQFPIFYGLIGFLTGLVAMLLLNHEGKINLFKEKGWFVIVYFTPVFLVGWPVMIFSYFLFKTKIIYIFDYINPYDIRLIDLMDGSYKRRIREGREKLKDSRT